MKGFLIFSALLAAAAATVSYFPSSRFLLPATMHRYQAQDEFGQYAFGYMEPLSSKHEVKTLDGVTRGSYSYTDSDGVLQTVDYMADAGGFRVAATNLPKAVDVSNTPISEVPQQVEDTAEVAAAKSAHLAAVEEAKLRTGGGEGSALTTSAIELPRQVEDTPEVAEAKAEHLNAVEAAKLRNAAIENIDNEFSLFRSSPLLSPLHLNYHSAVLPKGYAFAYGVDGGLLHNGHFLTSRVIH